MRTDTLLPFDASERHIFLELGAAEMRRARRYGHTLAVVTVHHERQHAAMVELALEAAIRAGIDVTARIARDRHACFLPETTIGGAVHLAARLERELARGGARRVRIELAALADDTTFAQLLARAAGDG